MLGLRLLIAVITCGKIKFTAARKPEWTIPGRPLKDTGSANKSCNQSRQLPGSLGGRVPRNATMIPIADCPTRQALMLFAVTAVGGRGVVDGVAENRVGRILACHRVNVVSGTARAEQGAIQRKVHTVILFLTLNVGPVVPKPQANVFTRRSLVPMLYLSRTASWSSTTGFSPLPVFANRMPPPFSGYVLRTLEFMVTKQV